MGAGSSSASTHTYDSGYSSIKSISKPTYKSVHNGPLSDTEKIIFELSPDVKKAIKEKAAGDTALEAKLTHQFAEFIASHTDFNYGIAVKDQHFGPNDLDKAKHYIINTLIPIKHVVNIDGQMHDYESLIANQYVHVGDKYIPTSEIEKKNKVPVYDLGSRQVTLDTLAPAKSYILLDDHMMKTEQDQGYLSDVQIFDKFLKFGPSDNLKATPIPDKLDLIDGKTGSNDEDDATRTHILVNFVVFVLIVLLAYWITEQILFRPSVNVIKVMRCNSSYDS
jgi:hypothetical protein